MSVKKEIASETKTQSRCTRDLTILGRVVVVIYEERCGQQDTARPRSKEESDRAATATSSAPQPSYVLCNRSGNNRVCVLTQLRKCANPHSEATRLNILSLLMNNTARGWETTVGESHLYLHTCSEPSMQREEGHIL